ncbi:thiamine-phosphate kinase [Maricaulis sp.]|uniref:thiamine-phosphate kinase n=1 Tax=Maricaulis sp. TaxID=1486257 RepID=UPI00262A7A62|nr:thiamine-phosphate kinase [Maricaulis sp.]
MSGGGEFNFIRQRLRPLTRGHPAALDLMDDAAILTPRPGESLVLASDMLIETVHFLSSDAPEVMAARAFGANLSDLAAMGAEPAGYLMAISWPKSWSDAQRDGFVAGLNAAAGDIPLIGGDTTSADAPLSVSITMLGFVPEGAGLTRSAAQAGHDVWVSGTIGDAGLGLDIARGKLDKQEHLLSRYQYPAARTELGQALRGLASACIDISDGMVADAGHIASASGVAIELEAAMIPLSTPVLHWLEGEGDEGLKRLVSSGDDYELLFTAPHDQAAKVLALSGRHGCEISWVGRVAEGEGVSVIAAEGDAMSFQSGGFTHF